MQETLRDSHALAAAYRPMRAGSFGTREAAIILFKHKWHVIGIVAAAVIAALVALLIIPPSFTAETKLLIRIGREKFSGLEPGFASQNVLFQEREQNVNNEIEILTDSNLLRDAFPRLQAVLPLPTDGPPPTSLWGWIVRIARIVLRWIGGEMKALIEYAKEPLYMLDIVQRLSEEEKLFRSFSRSLHVGYIKDTDVIDVDFSWDDPNFAAEAANIIVGVYRQHHLRVFDGASPAAYYQDKLAGLRSDLAAIDTKISAFLKTSNRASFDIEQQLDLGSIAGLDKQAQEAKLSRAEIASKIDQLTKMATGGPTVPVPWMETPPEAASVASLSGLDQRYAELTGKRNELATRFRPLAPELASADSDIAVLKRQKALALLDYDRAALRDLDGRIAGIEAKSADEQGRAVGMSGDALAYRRLLDDRKTAQQHVDDYAQKLSTVESNQDLDRQDVTSFSVVSAATPPVAEDGPPKSLLLALAAFLGLLAAGAGVSIAEIVRSTFRTAAEVEERLGIAVLGSLPHAR